MIYTYPCTILRSVCSEVATDAITDTFKKNIEIMKNEMHASSGCGLSAPQVGVSKRYFVADCQDEVGFEVFINPVITKKSDNFIQEAEGCLSFPGQYRLVKRHETVTVEYTNLENERKTLECSGLLSRCVQHEIDHLDGVLFTDK